MVAGNVHDVMNDVELQKTNICSICTKVKRSYINMSHELIPILSFTDIVGRVIKYFISLPSRRHIYANRVVSYWVINADCKVRLILS